MASFSFSPLTIGLLVVGFFVLLEILALAYMYYSVGAYSSFWKKKASQPGEIVYVALGDSAAQGIGATSPMRSYVGVLAKRIEAETGKSVRVVNLSVTGAKISDVLQRQLPQTQGISANIVTIEIGANNIGSFNANEFRAEFEQLALQLPAGTFVANMPHFGTRPSLTPKAAEATEIINDIIARNSQLVLVDLQTQTRQHGTIFGYAPDLFHPNNIAYIKNWANAFWPHIKNQLQTSTVGNY